MAALQCHAALDSIAARRGVRMAYPDIEQGRDYHAALKSIFAFHRTDWAERLEVLREVEDLCRQAAAAVDDAACREEMGIVADYAAEIFSRGEHRKWESESMSGAEFLRLQILKALDSFHSRLYSIEAIRRAGERQAAMVWRASSERR
jgi:hypothetical protein